MKKLKRFLGLLFFILIVSAFPVKAEMDIPKPTNLKYVNDYANVLSPETKEYIVSVGKELEDKTGAQSVVVIVNSLGEYDIETYATTLFRQWGIGQKEKNNGFLMLVSMQDRMRRVEVGYGLEGAVPDIYTDQVMESLFKPAFQKGEYDKGIKESYSAFADAIAKEYNVKLEKNDKVSLPQQQENKSSNGGLSL